MKELQDLQKKIKELTERKKLTNTPELCCLDLCSEIGELAKEVLRLTDFGKKDPEYNLRFQEELGDVFYSLISLANTYNVDLGEALEKTVKSIEDEG